MKGGLGAKPPKFTIYFLNFSEFLLNHHINIVISRVTENSVSTIEFCLLFLTKSNGLC